MRKFLTVFAAVSLIILFLSCLPLSVSAEEEGALGTLDLQGLKQHLAENDGKVVLMNFWSPF
ncbi:MAG: hypothetical protein NOU37_01520 [Candidatus Brocadiales bacterium]|nr:hypothetical protein [Candidatus Bathyanammoxibius amoris]